MGSSISIETRFPLALKPVRADANQVEMALLNLAVNARDAMPEGGQIVLASRDVFIRTDEPDGLKAGRYVCVSVSDTWRRDGPGHAEPCDGAVLYHEGAGQRHRARPANGTRACTAIGGRLILKSRVGEGTTAELWLPVDEGASAKEQSRPISPGAERQQALLVVLAVDDDYLVLTNTVAMLEDLGHTAIGASSGKSRHSNPPPVTIQLMW